MSVNGRRLLRLSSTLIALLAIGGCEKKEKAQAGEKSNIERLQEALPGAQVKPSDPEQLKKLGPSAVPGKLTDSAVVVRSRQALAGDGDAAYELHHHFQLKGNRAQAEYWARIGAENGEYNSMMAMGFALAQSTELESCLRAVYWFSRARTQLESDVKDVQAGQSKELLEMLIRAADEEISGARKQVPGC